MENYPRCKKPSVDRASSMAAAVAGLVAMVWSLRFDRYLPITDGWVTAERFCTPLPAVNLIFHEAGHVLFGFFGGEFLGVAGGTLMQLLLPAGALWNFLRLRQRAGTAFCLFWLGTNALNISLYAADAKAQALILITGMSGREGGGHDWAYMLERLGLLDHCVSIGRLFFFLGVALMSFAPLWILTSTLVARGRNRSTPR